MTDEYLSNKIRIREKELKEKLDVKVNLHKFVDIYCYYSVNWDKLAQKSIYFKYSVIMNQGTDLRVKNIQW